MKAESKASIAMSASRRIPMRSDDWREKSGESGVEDEDEDDEDAETEYIPRKKAAPRKGSIQQRARCSVEGCTTLAQRWGLCGKHGGFPRCSRKRCDKQAQRGGLCIAHGGVGSSKKPCSVEGCTTLANRWGLCSKHGGVARCSEEGCDKQAQKDGLCKAHFNSM